MRVSVTRLLALVAFALFAVSNAHAARYNIVCASAAGCVDASGATQAQGTVMSRVLWDGVSAFTPPAGTSAVLEGTPTATVAPPPASTSGLPVRDQRIVQLRAQFPINQRTAIAYSLKAALSTVCAVPAVAADTCYLGKVYNAALLLRRNNPGDAAAAVALVQDFADTAIHANGWKGLSSPDTQTVANYLTQLGADFFHFGTSQILFRIDREYGPNGTITPNVIGPALHNQIAALFFDWGSSYCLAAQTYADDANTIDELDYVGSENHGEMLNATCLAAAYEFVNTPSIASQTYPDGSTAAQAYALIVTRLNNLMSAEGGYGGPIEAYSDYNKYTFTCILMYFDLFPELRTMSKKLLDYWLSIWAISQIDGNYGGAKIRIYPTNGVLVNFLHGIAWLWTGQWSQYAADMNQYGLQAFLMTSYTPPDIVYDLALDKVGKGRYETLTGMFATVAANALLGLYQLDTSAPTMFGYSYVTPDYVQGAIVAPFISNAYSVWSNDSMQNWLNGVTFGNGDSRNRVHITASTSNNRTSYAGMRAIASKGAMIVKSMPAPYSHNVIGMDFYIGDTMTIVEQDSVNHLGWVFAYCAQGYVAIKVLTGNYSWGTTFKNTLDMKMGLGGIAVVQAAGVSDYADFAAFQAAVYATKPVVDTGTGVATYAGLAPASILTFNDVSGVVSISCSPFDFTQSIALKTPFVTQPWGSLTSTFTKGSRTLNFNFAR